MHRPCLELGDVYDDDEGQLERNYSDTENTFRDTRLESNTSWGCTCDSREREGDSQGATHATPPARATSLRGTRPRTPSRSSVLSQASIVVQVSFAIDFKDEEDDDDLYYDAEEYGPIDYNEYA